MWILPSNKKIMNFNKKLLFTNYLKNQIYRCYTSFINLFEIDFYRFRSS